MDRKVDVVIIGAGSAGLAALRQMLQTTENYLLIDPGPLGTTCARVGCMPSKALIEVAKDYHRLKKLWQEGIVHGAPPCDIPPCDIPAVLRHVRRLRDGFTGGMVDVTRKLAGQRLVTGTATVLSPTRVLVDEKEVECERIILAVGSRPIVPKAWQGFGDRVLTTDTFFEQQDLPRRMALIGLGTNGLELGQALARLGIEVTGFGRNPHICGIRDPEVNQAALAAFRREFPLYAGSAAEVIPRGSALLVRNGSNEAEVDAFIAAIGTWPNFDGLGLENLGVELNERGMPPFNPGSMQIGDLPVFIAGDANGCLPLLHEAQDEGFISGRNATGGDVQTFRRRTPLRIGFSDPQVAAVGLTVEKLDAAKVVVGRTDFSDQSRAILEGRNVGRLHVYVEKSTARLLGAEMVVPDAEHLAHLLALSIQQKLTVHEALTAPFYHPTVEEGLRSALRDAAGKLDIRIPEELVLCESCPVQVLC